MNMMTCGNIKIVIDKVLAYKFSKLIGGVTLCLYNWLFEDPQIFAAVYILIIFDTISGFSVACKSKTVTSRDFFRSIIKGFVYFIMIITGRIVDKVVPLTFASTIIESFLVITEGLSILENLNKLGFPIPNKLLNILKSD